jgi:cytochrome P450
MKASENSVDLFGHNYYQDPFPAYRWLQENSPMHAFNFPVGNVPMWMVTRFDDVHRVMRDPRFSTNPRWASAEFRDAGLAVGAGTPVERLITMLDPPDHTRIRKLVADTFSPRRIAGWNEPVAKIVDTELDRLHGQDQYDLMELASAIPARVIGDLLGHRLDYHAMVDAIARAFNIDPNRPGESNRAFEEISDYGRNLIAKKRKAPGDDLTSALIRAHDGADRLDDQELVAMIDVMIMAGLDTTRNLIGSAILALMDFPEQRTLLRERPALITGAVEEFIRYTGGVTLGFFRFPTTDLEFDQTYLPAGTPVVTSIAAANRDPRRFADPDSLIITRSGPAHVGLGLGIHFCLGSSLARLVAGIAISAILTRFPRMSLGVPRDEIHYDEMWLVRSIDALPVRLHNHEEK